MRSQHKSITPTKQYMGAATTIEPIIEEGFSSPRYLATEDDLQTSLYS